ncbi:MAG: HAD family phosphatase [Solobacterium sp.]|nr:HAD family phosphatase [Solobacterium sp.]
MTYNGVIFDFNGTLFFDTKYHVLAWNEISMELCGRQVTEEIMDKEISGVPNAEVVLRMKPSLTRAEAEEYSRKKEELYRGFVQSAPGGEHLVKGAAELFDWLRENDIPFTIASASIIENIEFFIRYFHLDHWLDPAMIVYDDGSYQDKISMFEEAKKRIHADQILIFEDSLSGIKCAQEIGADVIALETQSLMHIYKDYPCVIHTMKDFTDIIPFLREMRAFQ